MIYNDDTLFHAIGFNFMKLESILRYGLVSYDYALKNGILYSKNYKFSVNEKVVKEKHLLGNVNDMISSQSNENIYLVRNLYVSNDKESAYQLYVLNGISLVVEDVPFISDVRREFIKRSDEVVVKDYIPRDKIKAIVIPDEYAMMAISDINILPTNMMNYKLIVDNVMMFLSYLKSYNYDYDEEEITYLLKDLKVATRSVKSLEKGTEEYMEAFNDYVDIFNDINYFLAKECQECFNRIFKREVTVMDILKYIGNKYRCMQVLELSTGYKNRSK